MDPRDAVWAQQRPEVSVVAPVYNERDCLEELVRRLHQVLGGRRYEVILVDDGSRDGSWDEITRLRGLYPAVKGLRFSRNFGHHVAITAGLDWTRADWVVVMDSDLQDLPEAIPDLLQKAAEGYDVVLARRQGKRHGPVKRFLSRAFAGAMRWLSDLEFNDAEGVFRVMRRDVVTAICALRETPRYFVGLVAWVGFRRAWVDVRHGDRFAGETKYPLGKQVVLAVRAALAFSDKPLQVAAVSGLVIAGVGLLYAVVIVVRALLGQIAVSGYASLMSAVLVVGGLGIATSGLVGLYVGRVFTQTKGRPLYVVSAAEGLPAGVLPPGHEGAGLPLAASRAEYPEFLAKE